MKYSKYFLLLILFFSCDAANDNYYSMISGVIKENQATMDLTKYEAVIFIPVEGCGSCILQSVSFLKSNSSNGKYCFIINANSSKESNIVIGEENMNLENVMLDSEYSSIRKGLVGLKPVVYFLDKDKVIDRKELSDENSAEIFSTLINN